MKAAVPSTEVERLAEQAERNIIRLCRYGNEALRYQNAFISRRTCTAEPDTIRLLAGVNVMKKTAEEYSAEAKKAAIKSGFDPKDTAGINAYAVGYLSAQLAQRTNPPSWPGIPNFLKDKQTKEIMS